MSQIELIKIGADGAQLPSDASEWDAVLLPQHGLMFTATNVASNVPHADCEAAAKACRVLGFEDWDLPEVDQLQLLVDRARYSPAINTDFFRGIENDWYWTKTPAAWSSAAAWYVSFHSGSVLSNRRDYGGFALAVRRAGQ